MPDNYWAIIMNRKRCYTLFTLSLLTIFSLSLSSCTAFQSMDSSHAEGGSGILDDVGVSPKSPLVTPLESPLAPGTTSPLPVPEEHPQEAVHTDLTGSIIGAVVMKTVDSGDNYQPGASQKIALADLLSSLENDLEIAAYEPAIAIHTTSDASGRFAMNDIPPGKYALILDQVLHQWVLVDPETGIGITVEIDGGETIDVGTIFVDTTRQ